MESKQIVILVATIFAVIIYFNIPVNKAWLDNRILVFTDNIHEELNNRDLEFRRKRRWEAQYMGVTQVKATAEMYNIKEPLLLVPPPEYYQSIYPGFTFPEPVICYYFAGLRTTTMTCEDVYKANCCLIIENGAMRIMPLQSKEEIDRVINIFKSANKPS